MSNLDFNCPMCLEVYENPVVLSCCHSFCKACLQGWWTQKVTRECPVCKRRSSRTDPPCNLVLKNLCEAFSQQLTLRQSSEQPMPLCPQHKEKLQLYCVDHQQLVCLVCRDSRAHHKHRFSPIDEMAQEHREQLRKSLQPQQEMLEKLVKMEVSWDGTAEHIKQQGQHTERMIQRQFDQMRALLQREEQTRIRALRTEVEQKTQQMDRSRAALKQKQTKVSGTIQATEAQLKCDDVSLLQNYAPDRKRVDECGLNIEPLPPGTLVNVAKHLGNLSFNIWSQMKNIVSYTSVVLDPNTASSNLIVSDDLQSVQYKKTDTALSIDNPDRNNRYVLVLGTKGFSSGVHSWQVDIQGEVDVNEDGWSVGVVNADAPRNEAITSGSWEIWLRKGKYTAYAPPFVDEVLSFPHEGRPLRRIRVDLDWEGGQLTFSDPQTNKHIYTYKHLFTKTLYPFVGPSAAHTVKVLPLNISVNLQKESQFLLTPVSADQPNTQTRTKNYLKSKNRITPLNNFPKIF